MALPILKPSFVSPELDPIIFGDRVTTRFKFELYDRQGFYKTDLDCVLEGGSVKNNYLAEIKGTCSFDVAEIGNFDQINFLTDQVKPYCEIFDYYNNQWLSYPLGVYLMSAGTRVASQGVVTRAVTGYDKTQILKDAKHTTRFVVPVGTNIVSAVRTLLSENDIQHNIEDSNETIIAERTYDPGTEVIATINDLLSMITYKSLYFDVNGIAVSGEYVSPNDREPDKGYVTDRASLVAEGANLTLNLFDVYNEVLVVVSQPDRPLITAVATNTNPESPTSTVNTGRTNTKVYDDNQDLTTQAQANAQAKKYLTEISQVYEQIEFSTPIIPTHGENSIISITHTELGVDAIYSETEWSLPLVSGQLMTHSARRTVVV